MIQETSTQFAPARATKLRAPRMILPKIDTELAAIWSRLAGHDISGALTLDGKSWQYGPYGAMDLVSGVGTVIRMTVGGAMIQVSLTQNVSHWIGEFAEYFEPFEERSPAQLAMVLEHFLSEEIAALEDAWGAEIRLLEVELSSRFDCADSIGAWRVTHDALALEVEAFVDAADRQALADRLAGAFPRKARRDLSHLKVSLSVLGPIARLSHARLARLQVGSVYFPDPEWSSMQQLVRFVGWTHNIMPAMQTRGGLEIVGPNAQLHALTHSPSEEERDMSSGMIGNKTDNASTAVVAVELTQEQFRVTDLEELREGAVLELSVEQVEEVTLTSGGRPIARGRLVQLDETIGVQITGLL